MIKYKKPVGFLGLIPCLYFIFLRSSEIRLTHKAVFSDSAYCFLPRRYHLLALLKILLMVFDAMKLLDFSCPLGDCGFCELPCWADHNAPLAHYSLSLPHPLSLKRSLWPSGLLRDGSV